MARLQIAGGTFFSFCAPFVTKIIESYSVCELIAQKGLGILYRLELGIYVTCMLWYRNGYTQALTKVGDVQISPEFIFTNS